MEVRWGGNGSKDATAADADAGAWGGCWGGGGGGRCGAGGVGGAGGGGRWAASTRSCCAPARVMAAVLGAGAGAGAEGGAGPMRGMGGTRAARGWARRRWCARCCGTRRCAVRCGGGHRLLRGGRWGERGARLRRLRRPPRAALLRSSSLTMPRPSLRARRAPHRARGARHGPPPRRLHRCPRCCSAPRAFPRRGLQRPALQRCAAPPSPPPRAPCA